MNGAVKLSEFVESWTCTDPWTSFFLDHKTGEIIPITDFEFYEAEKPIHWRPGPRACPGVLFRRTRPWLKATGEWRAEGSSLDAEPQLDGRRDIIQIAKAVLDGNKRYIRLPSRSETEAYAIIREQFCATVEDDQISEILSESLKHFRGEEVFNNALIRYGMAEDWESWYCRQQIAAAKEWCENNDVEFIEDI